MELDDRASIRTPEGIDLDLTLAGLGSRFGAAVVDSLILGVLLVLAAFGLGMVGSALGEDLGLLLAGAVSLTIFVVLLGYFVVFETWNDGRTPGKAAFGLRVVSHTGEPIGFWGSVIRNLIRIVDFLPAFYAAGAISILATPSNQRLGDMAARSLVVRDRVLVSAGMRLPPLPETSGWDVSAVTEDEVALIRRFVERARSLDASRREEIAGRIASRLRPRVGGVDRAYRDEEFIVRVLAEKLSRSG